MSERKINIESKREREKEVVSQMIALYCHKNHRGKGRGESTCSEDNTDSKTQGTYGKKTLCPECAALDAYARMRSDKCPFMETKTFCSNCKVHCYKSDMREQIRAVMRFSGPRMLFTHPVMAIRHVIESQREKKQLEQEAESGKPGKSGK